MEAHEVIQQTLGQTGRMIAASKGRYLQANPNNLVVFNANVCTENTKIWYGDLDLTLDKEKLSLAAVALGKEIYVLRELDGRFLNEDSPRTDKYVVRFKPDGGWELGSVRTNVNQDQLTLIK
jgi:hypothetical protein